jgi:hypothetical protein
MVPADGVPVEAGVRDFHDQRVAATLDAGRHLLHDQAGRMFVHLLEQASAHALTVEALLLRGDGAQEAARRRHRQVVDRRHEPFRSDGELATIFSASANGIFAWSSCVAAKKTCAFRSPSATARYSISPTANGVFPEPFAISM